MESCPVVKNILLLDSEGKRVAVKYYTDDWDTLASKLAFEKSIFTKTQRCNAPAEEAKGWNHFHVRREVNKLPCWRRHHVAAPSDHFKFNMLTSDIGMFDGYIVVYKFISDLHFFVTGGENENELILATVLQGFFDAVSTLLRNNVEKRTALENLDLILLCIDEMVDGGIILETEPSSITGRVSMRGSDIDAPLAEQTISQAFAMAREHLARSLLN